LFKPLSLSINGFTSLRASERFDSRADGMMLQDYPVQIIKVALYFWPK